MPTRSKLAAALALLLPIAVPAATDVKASSRVDAVTVYRSGARVTRIARAELPAGDVRLLVEGLPVGIVDDSIRVEGQGASKGKIWGVSVEPFTLATVVDDAARDAEEKIEKLLAEERAKNLAVRGVTSKEWSDLAGFVDGELTAAAAETRKVEAARRELGRKVAAARADLDKLRAK